MVGGSVLTMPQKLADLFSIVRCYGLDWLVARLWYELKVRSGLQVLRLPKRSWRCDELSHWLSPGVPSEPQAYADYRRQHRPPFFFRQEDRAMYGEHLRGILGKTGSQALLEEADNIRRGCWRYFFAQWGDLGIPPDWHLNPFTGQRTSPTAHWSRIPVFSRATGDIKFIWEPGRFATAYTLARAYWLTGDAEYAGTFWRVIESWRDANPPNHGAHWRCGQEISLRLMAWCFSLYAFADAPTTTPDRIAMLVGMIAAQAERVAGDHVYAYLQGNNHAISEGVGLWTVGLLFPELKHAAKWRETGRSILEAEGRRQIYEDGAYIQQSMNYHRLMLHDYLWAIRLGEVTGSELSPALCKRVRQAGSLLYQLQDEASGRVPNYGSNDGALILALNTRNYQDFRPVLGSVHYLFNRARLYPAGPWDEDLLWLFGPEALEAEQEGVERTSWAASVGGYYTLRGERSWGMIRCAKSQDRPSRADMLHLDIWRDGVNVACDAGSYRYYADSPWNNGLVSTSVHNTISVDDADQIRRGPRFLWLDWVQSQVRHHAASEKERLVYFEGAHDGYTRLTEPVIHCRAVLKARDVWIVVDDLLGEGRHRLRLHWLLADLPYVVDTGRRQVSLRMGDDVYGLRVFLPIPGQAKGEFDVIRGTEESAPRGWQSSYYGVRHPALSVELCAETQVPCRFVSVFVPEATNCEISVSHERIGISGEGLELTAHLLSPGYSSIVGEVVLDSSAGQGRLVIGQVWEV